ncbi:XRE family transcriptional regulator [Halobacillus trueperi]|uniref:XRE family transcriptional regulator n=1 Tax=Halobacillus trueperi TaxID=156205 RepID=A0A3D8VD64_9BACI|nr:helix-turn-helix transcriptional regulator [Halobacillus trueperi]RDY67306.1 XRE family transcriptional regulator [Halobacillus trueperi]
MSELGERLKDLRIQKRNESIREVSKKVGISHTYLSTLEKGYDPRTKKERKPTIEVIKNLSGYYRLSTSDYLDLLVMAGYKEEARKEALWIRHSHLEAEAISTKEDMRKNAEELGVELRENIHLNKVLTDEHNDIFYKGHKLTKEEKKKVITLIDTILE